jgi:hypothetical protein
MQSECGVNFGKEMLDKVVYVVDEKTDMGRKLLQSVSSPFL